MRRIVLYLGMSLDGFAADRAGGVDWMEGQDPSDRREGSYDQFIQTVDTVWMGRTTYDQVTQQLSPGVWPYEGLETYVFTHRPAPGVVVPAGVRFTDAPLDRLARELRTRPGRDIWLCGGADLARQALALDLVDQLRLTILPVLLGGGAPLFGPLDAPKKLALEQIEEQNGMVECVYRRREEWARRDL